MPPRKRPPSRAPSRAPRRAPTPPAETAAVAPASAKRPTATIPPPPAERTRPPWAPESPDKRMWLVAGATALLALLLRLPTLSTRSLWFDEIHTWKDAYWMYPEGRTHWLFFRIVAVFTEWFGRNEVGLRMYPLLAGVGAVFLLTVWVWRIGGRLPGVLAGLALAFSATHVDYSQEGRYYAPMVAFAVGALWAGTEFFLARDWRRWTWLALLAFFLWMGVTNHSTSMVFALVLAMWMAGCAVAAPWGRRLVARVIVGSRPASPGRVWGLGVVASVVCAFVLWRAYGTLEGYIARIDFSRRTPQVSFTLDFFLRTFRRFGAGWSPGSLLGKLGWIVYETGFFVGVAWLLRRRAAWGALVILGIGATLFSVFAYPVTQTYSPKYIAYIWPLRLLGFAAGWSWLLGMVFLRRPTSETPGAPGTGGAPARRETVAALVGGLVLLLIAFVPLRDHYRGARTPVRPALEWIRKNAPSEARIVSYGHTNYPIEYYASKLKMNLRRFLVLEWPSESGNLDMAVVRAAVPPDGELYFVHGWPHDIPPNLRRGLDEEFEEVARFRSSERKSLDTVVHRWKYGGATLREGRTLELASPDAEGETVSLYSIYGMTAVVETEAPAAFAVVNGERVPLAPSAEESNPLRSASVAFAPGPAALFLENSEGARIGGRLFLKPSSPLDIVIPALQVANRGQRGEMEDREFQGRPALRFVKNNWVEYRMALEPGTVYECVVTGFQSPDGPAWFEIELDGRYAGLVHFFGVTSEWVERAFPFRAVSSPTTLRLRLVSEIATATGSTSPGVGGALDSLRIRERAFGTEDEPLVDNRTEIESLLDSLPDGDALLFDPASPGLPAESWRAMPEFFVASVVDQVAEEPDATAHPRLRLQMRPPYSAYALSPSFPLVPGRIVYLQVPVEVDEIYCIGATIFLHLDNQEGHSFQVFASEGGLEDRIDWDYIYRAFEGPNRKRYTFFFEVPEGYTLGNLGVLMWPSRRVPHRTPNMTLTIAPPIAPSPTRPDLLNR